MQVISTAVSVIVAAATALLVILTIIQYRRLGKLDQEITTVTRRVEHDIAGGQDL